ncbi:MAG: hypothetical protein ACOCUT_03800, partial [bacterium]
NSGVGLPYTGKKWGKDVSAFLDDGGLKDEACLLTRCGQFVNLRVSMLREEKTEKNLLFENACRPWQAGQKIHRFGF